MHTSTPFVNLFELSKQVLRERNFLTEFSSEILDEVKHIQNSFKLPSAVIDLRSKLWSSIDHTESQDLDQIAYAEPIGQKGYRIFVAIADVDFLVAKDSALNQFAEHNTISIYTPAKVFTMLPIELSYHLTSLLENQDRLAVVVEIEISLTGLIEKYKAYSALVQNKAKLSYDVLADWLEGKASKPLKIAKIPGLEEQIQLQDKISKCLRQFRIDHGALLFSKDEVDPIVQNGQVVSINIITENRARSIIEDFMITANAAIARLLRNKKIPSLRRVVRTPYRWDRIIEIARQYGVNLPSKPDPKPLQEFLLKRKTVDPTSFSDLSLTIIKLLGRGEYIVEYPGEPPIGHFSLSVHYYTHFTAPNRRFIDLMNQRMIKSLLNDQTLPYKPEELEKLAKYCTEKEDDAARVERQLRKSATILFISSKLNQTFDALVTGTGPKGTWVKTFHPPSEGRLMEGFESVDVGDKIKVLLKQVNVEKGYIDFIKI